MPLTTEEQYGIAQVCFYFGLLLSAFAVVVWKLPARPTKSNGVTIAFLLFQAFADLLFTWYYILKFIAEDIQSYATWKDWMENGELFFRAYELVTAEPGRWFWSSQLLNWVLVGVVFMVLEGKRLRIHHVWAYVMLGFLGAISVAFPLFYAHVIRSRQSLENSKAKKETPTEMPNLLKLCLVLAWVSSFYMPIVLEAGDKFMFNVCLLVVHCILLLPAFLQMFDYTKEDEAIRATPSFMRVLMFVCLLGFGTHVYNTKVYLDWYAHETEMDLLRLLKSPAALSNAFVDLVVKQIPHNDCQISITADVIMTHLATAVFCLSESKSFAVFIVFLVSGTVLSPIVPTTLFIVYREFYLLPKCAKHAKVD